MIWFWGVIGILVLVPALFEARAVHRLSNHGLHAEGTVIENVRSRSAQKKHWVAIVAFTDHEGYQVECNPGLYSRWRKRPVGSTVPLLYLPGRSQEARANLRWPLWSPSVLFIGFGLSCFVVLIAGLLKFGA